MELTKEQKELLKNNPLAQLLLSVFGDGVVVVNEEKATPVEIPIVKKDITPKWEFPLTKENYDFLAKSALEFNRCLNTAKQIGLDINIKDLTLVGSLFNMVYFLLRVFIDENFANRFAAGLCSDNLNPEYLKDLYHEQTRV